MRLRLPGLDGRWQVLERGDGGLELRRPSIGVLHVDPPRPLPVDWNRWLAAQVGSAILEPVRETVTRPGGWRLTVLVTGAPDGAELRVHAFYVFFEQVVRLVAVLAPAVFAEVRSQLMDLLEGGEPRWEGAPVVALSEL